MTNPWRGYLHRDGVPDRLGGRDRVGGRIDDVEVRHRESGAACTLLSLKTDETKDFGRVLRKEDGSVDRIVENKDATPREKTVDEYNSGVYCFCKDILFKALRGVDNRNAQREYYLTDTIYRIHQEGLNIHAIQTRDTSEIFGINSLEDLNTAEQLYSERILNP